ncbi:MAG TPA: DUF5666 domain-containing protein [bacterium]|nr:DUF5666 domain-containing protein [bacterium]
MRRRALTALAVLVPLLAAPQLAAAQSPFSVSGYVVILHSAPGSVVLQDVAPGATPGATWTVHLSAATETRRGTGVVVRGIPGAFALLRVGDLVDVQGWIIGANTVLAATIAVRTTFGGGSDADDDADDRSFIVAGVITRLESRGQGVVTLREQIGYGPGIRLWTIRLHPRTRVNGLMAGGDVPLGRGRRAALRLLRVGDFVEVSGHLEGWQIRAQVIRVRARSGASPAPFRLQTVILAPAQGTEITGSEFAVVGQTVPGAEVRIQVTGRFGVFNVPVASGTVTANERGVFTFTVRPSARVPGTTYTITVTSIFQGQSALPVTLTVRQQ